MIRHRNPYRVHEYKTRHGKTVFYLRCPGHKGVRLNIPPEVSP